MPIDGGHLRKLEAIRNRIASLLSGYNAPNKLVDPVDFEPAMERWIAMYAELAAADDEVSFVTAPAMPAKHDNTMAYEGRGGYSREWLVRLSRDVNEVVVIATHPTKHNAPVTIDREGIFTAGQPFDAMLAATNIFKTAKSSIVLVDGYVSERTLNLLGIKAPGVTVRVLTYSLDAPTHELAKAFQKQHSGLDVRTSKRFHDRFLIIDDADFYHFGHSIKDAAIKSTFMFSRIEEPSVKALLKNDFDGEWNKATVLALT